MSKTIPYLFICLVFLCTSFSQAQQIGGATTGSEICFSCHKDQAKDWGTTWHSRSHVDSNPLYKAVIDYMSRITYQPEAGVLVECAQCHNPKMTIKEIADKDSFALSEALKIKTAQTERVEASVKDKAIKDGISCNICHNVAKINETSNLQMRGFKAVEWGSSDTIYGPFEDDGRARIHKSLQKEHFVNPNQLCMVCHFGGERSGIEIYTTGIEYTQSGSKETCAECHMSTKRQGTIAPEIKKTGVTAEVRDIRSHLFASARNSNVLEDTIELTATSSGKNFVVTLRNLTPHKAPTGFGGRSMNVKMEFKDASGSIVNVQTYVLETVYADKKGQETIPYLAAAIKSDTRLNANEIRKLSIPKPAGATSVTVNVTYRLASERLLKIINFSDSIFNKEYPVKSINVGL
ncbi:MAG: cytochrome c family protein [Campylobacteraceae bacterium]|jgi:nitrate/TMAO reductase-like tetraheme cytochrome c subunit|nr:cytochrome c family protein [Campylobacteraceae bacterium]